MIWLWIRRLADSGRAVVKSKKCEWQGTIIWRSDRWEIFDAREDTEKKKLFSPFAYITFSVLVFPIPRLSLRARLGGREKSSNPHNWIRPDRGSFRSCSAGCRHWCKALELGASHINIFSIRESIWRVDHLALLYAWRIKVDWMLQ